MARFRGKEEWYSYGAQRACRRPGGHPETAWCRRQSRIALACEPQGTRKADFDKQAHVSRSASVSGLDVWWHSVACSPGHFPACSLSLADRDLSPKGYPFFWISVSHWITFLGGFLLLKGWPVSSLPKMAPRHEEGQRSPGLFSRLSCDPTQL